MSDAVEKAKLLYGTYAKLIISDLDGNWSTSRDVERECNDVIATMSPGEVEELGAYFEGLDEAEQPMKVAFSFEHVELRKKHEPYYGFTTPWF